MSIETFTLHLIFRMIFTPLCLLARLAIIVFTPIIMITASICLRILYLSFWSSVEFLWCVLQLFFWYLFRPVALFLWSWLSVWLWSVHTYNYDVAMELFWRSNSFLTTRHAFEWCLVFVYFVYFAMTVFILWFCFHKKGSLKPLPRQQGRRYASPRRCHRKKIRVSKLRRRDDEEVQRCIRADVAPAAEATLDACCSSVDSGKTVTERLTVPTVSSIFERESASVVSASTFSPPRREQAVHVSVLTAVPATLISEPSVMVQPAPDFHFGVSLQQTLGFTSCVSSGSASYCYRHGVPPGLNSVHYRKLRPSVVFRQVFRPDRCARIAFISRFVKFIRKYQRSMPEAMDWEYTGDSYTLTSPSGSPSVVFDKGCLGQLSSPVAGSQVASSKSLDIIVDEDIVMKSPLCSSAVVSAQLGWPRLGLAFASAWDSGMVERPAVSLMDNVCPPVVTSVASVTTLDASGFNPQVADVQTNSVVVVETSDTAVRKSPVRQDLSSELPSTMTFNDGSTLSEVSTIPPVAVSSSAVSSERVILFPRRLRKKLSSSNKTAPIAPSALSPAARTTRPPMLDSKVADTVADSFPSVSSSETMTVVAPAGPSTTTKTRPPPFPPPLPPATTSSSFVLPILNRPPLSPSLRGQSGTNPPSLLDLLENAASNDFVDRLKNGSIFDDSDSEEN